MSYIYRQAVNVGIGMIGSFWRLYLYRDNHGHCEITRRWQGEKKKHMDLNSFMLILMVSSFMYASA